MQQEIVQKQHDLEAVTEQYLEAQDALKVQSVAATQAAAAYLQAVKTATALQNDVSTMGARAYKAEQLPTVAAVMTGSSPAEILGRLSTLDRLTDRKSDKLINLAKAQQQAAKNNTAAAQAKSAAAATASAIAAKKAKLETEVPQLEAQLASLTAEQRAAVLAISGGAEVTPAAAPDPQPAPSGTQTPQPTAGAGGTAAAQIAIEAALSRLGMPYAWGATGPTSFDCSGLMLWSYAKAGISLPRTSTAQSQVGTSVPMSGLAPGDMVWAPGHIGLYIGSGQVVHAPTTGDVVKVISLSTMNWQTATRPTG